MLFEKPLRDPVSNWQMNLGKFLFQEDPEKSEVFMVRLFDQEKPRIYKFQLPMRVFFAQNPLRESSKKNITNIAETKSFADFGSEIDLEESRATPNSIMFEEFKSPKNRSN